MPSPYCESGMEAGGNQTPQPPGSEVPPVQEGSQRETDSSPAGMSLIERKSHGLRITLILALLLWLLIYWLWRIA